MISDYSFYFKRGRKISQSFVDWRSTGLSILGAFAKVPRGKR